MSESPQVIPEGQKVYVTNDTGLDLTRADAYGERVTLVTGSPDIFNPDRLYKRLRAMLEGFVPERDYLCVAGSNMVCGLALAALSSLYPEENVKLLLFDARRGSYIDRVVRLD